METPPPREREQRLMERLGELVAPLGFEIIQVEVQNQRQKILRVFIDRPVSDASGVTLDDCAAVSRALDGPLDSMPEMDSLFRGSYQLEVSSPGVDRPLRRPADYDRFRGREARIHVFRPLTEAEIDSPGYLAKNPRQKNFVGRLAGFRAGKVLLSIPRGADDDASVAIPLELISKAHLEPMLEPGRPEKKRD